MRDAVTRETAASYDRIVDHYEERAATVTPEFGSFRTAFAARVPPGGQVLDLGCGPGRDAAHFTVAGFRVVGLDSSPGMAARARRNGAAVAVGDHRRPPFGAGTADGLWSSATLLHVPRGDVSATLAQWRRVLQTGGVLGLSTSLGDSEGWEDVPYAADDDAPDVQLRRWFVHWSRGDLLALVIAAGFTVLSAEERTSHRRWLQVLAEAGDDADRSLHM